MRLDSGLLHLLLLQESRRIVADFTDVACLQSPSRAGSDGGGHLPARENFRNAEFDLGIKSREVREADDRVGSVQPHANDIDDGNGFCHRDTVRKSHSGARGNEWRKCV